MTGMLADRLGLDGALRLVPLIAIVASLAFTLGRRHYDKGLVSASAPAPALEKTEISI